MIDIGEITLFMKPDKGRIILMIVMQILFDR